ncbi:Cof-type HAD-IIB family hydrolase [Bacillus sp. 1NLA3E]|uniref:Cof-type HAD-IIB family hydrolase n=1 Tax=Bacillus sp. 1NLA3E TaxID=666686 RepID=UPI000247EF91|nr:Cof-type HAD-IIB family hydrolase [Bacillus sp. 1NLA3E]AGK56113.1 cof family hydrolase [Bacillus sp. 1NLA3E]
MIKLIASDMDGTLLTGNKGVSTANKEAIRLAQAKGIEFVIATGRSYQEALLVLKEAEIDCSVICVNGAEVRAKDGTIVSSHPLAKELANFVAQTLVKHGVYFEMYTNKGTYTTDQEKAVSVMVDIFTSANHHYSRDEVEKVAKQRIKSGYVKVVDQYDKIFVDKSYHVYKLLAFSGDVDQLLTVRQALAEFNAFAVSSSGHGNLEITSKDAQKGVALEEFAKIKNIPLLETMAIGDNDNDLSMLTRVGHSVAMGNAADHIKEKCRYVTATNADDGVGKAIMRALQDSV